MVRITSLSVVPFAALVLIACGSDPIEPIQSNEPPTVTSISPAIGQLAGGMSVTITGTNFIDITDVTIGGSPVGNRTVVNSTQITGTTPASTSTGGRDVVVNSSNHGWGVCGGCFVYHATSNRNQITAGWNHTCALTTTGAAYCWGNNAYGSLGNGTTTNSSTPVAVSGGLTFTNIVAGGWHTCALTNGEDTYCWGLNDARQLGQLGTTQPAMSPVPVQVFAPKFITLVATLGHTCGLASYGGAWCWGANSFGQLGTGSRANSPPVNVLGVTFTSIDAGGYHTCGVASSGSAYCWGLNLSGELGNGSQGTNADALTPTVVIAGGFSAIFGGLYHSCGLSAAGIAACWGTNLYGGLGFGSRSGLDYCPAEPNTGDCSVRPFPVAGGHFFKTLALGGYHTCGIDLFGAAYCWGSNTVGQLGNGSTTQANFPIAVSGGLSFTTITAAITDYTCGLTTTGAMYCWGRNDVGQLGNGSTNDSAIPVAVSGFPPQ